MNSIFKINKDKCLKDLILNPFRYSETISKSKLLGGRYTRAQMAFGEVIQAAGKVRSGARTTIRGGDDDQGRGRRSGAGTTIRGEDDDQGRGR